jgi:dipicolinate synthase subunit A
MRVEQKLRLLVAGGDQRQHFAASYLAKQHTLSVQTVGIPASTVEGEALPETDVLLLPRLSQTTSIAGRTLPDFLSCVKTGGLVCAGAVTEAVTALCQAHQLAICDYMQRADFCLANAVPTVEGAIQIAMTETKTTICGSRVLVIGYGRIGSLLAERLRGLCADVTVAARSANDAVRCQVQGCHWIPPEEMAANAAGFDWICNTVPAPIWGERELTAMRQDSFLVDLASSPGGTDFAAAERLQRHVIWALALPGKVAPLTAGEIIAKTVFHILQERGLVYERDVG